MARKLKGVPGRVLVVVGDGALTNGISYEGLNNIGASGLPIVIILNDNEHSISKNVGAMAAYLAKLRSSGTYKSMKNFVTSTLERLGLRTLKKLLKKRSWHSRKRFS